MRSYKLSSQKKILSSCFQEHNEQLQVGRLTKSLFWLSLWLNTHQKAEMWCLLNSRAHILSLGCVVVGADGSVGQWSKVYVCIRLQGNIGNLFTADIYHPYVFLKATPIPSVLRISEFKNQGEDPK